ncbi:hypothetical protein BB561_001652 [Smittium simulii]|uniref:SAM domain-containing protein n=1 Tax=Smittium simulii TaxID=133385 RepID=A0A2T9YTP9_9FUNG|nr:hypothetical protein BB561_001652 [Smittium simulii]
MKKSTSKRFLTPSADPQTWSVEDVCLWLGSTPLLSEFVSVAQVHSIDGYILTNYLTNSILKEELGISSFGKRVRFLEALEILKWNLSANKKSHNCHFRGLSLYDTSKLVSNDIKLDTNASNTVSQNKDCIPNSTPNSPLVSCKPDHQNDNLSPKHISLEPNPIATPNVNIKIESNDLLPKATRSKRLSSQNSPLSLNRSGSSIYIEKYLKLEPTEAANLTPTELKRAAHRLADSEKKRIKRQELKKDPIAYAQYLQKERDRNARRRARLRQEKENKDLLHKNQPNSILSNSMLNSDSLVNNEKNPKSVKSSILTQLEIIANTDANTEYGDNTPIDSHNNSCVSFTSLALPDKAFNRSKMSSSMSSYDIHSNKNVDDSKYNSETLRLDDNAKTDNISTNPQSEEINSLVKQQENINIENKDTITDKSNNYLKSCDNTKQDFSYSNKKPSYENTVDILCSFRDNIDGFQSTPDYQDDIFKHEITRNKAQQNSALDLSSETVYTSPINEDFHNIKDKKFDYDHQLTNENNCSADSYDNALSLKNTNKISTENFSNLQQSLDLNCNNKKFLEEKQITNKYQTRGKKNKAKQY